MQIDEKLDEFDIKLLDATNLLKECQNKKDLYTCMKCENMFECEIRDNYVDAVYKSMSKGSITDFEF